MDACFKSLKDMSERGPYGMRLIFVFLRKAYSFFRIFYVMLCVDVWVLKGKDPASQADLSIVFAGLEREKNYLTRMAFQSRCEEIHLGKHWLWGIRGLVRTKVPGANILICETTRYFSALFCRRASFRMPVWVDGDMDRSLIDYSHRSIQSDIKNVQKNGFSSEITSDPVEVRRAFDELYVPFVEEQYAGEINKVLFSNLVSQYDKVEALLVKKDGEQIGVHVFCYKNDVVFLKCIGVRVPSVELVKAGAIQAMYYFMYQYFNERSVKRVVFGVSRSFFNDGVLSYKHKWGLRLTKSCLEVWNVDLLVDDCATRGFLLHHPLIALYKGKLIALIFLATSKDFKKFGLYQWPGLERVVGCFMEDEGGYYQDKSCRTSCSFLSLRQLFDRKFGLLF